MCLYQKNDLYIYRVMQECSGFSYRDLPPNFQQLQRALSGGHSDANGQKLEAQPQATNGRTTP